MPRKAVILIMLLALALPVAAWADDLNPPAWRGGGNTIYAIWDTWSGYNPQFPAVIYPDTNSYYSNPPGIFPPYLTGLDVLSIYEEDSIVSIVFDTSGQIYPVLQLKADNYDRQNPEKRIRIQMTYRYNRDVVIDTIDTVDPAAVSITQLVDDQTVGPDQYYSAWDIVIRPNPFIETIYFGLPGTCNFVLDQLVFDSICVVPLPGSLLLLGSGIMGLLTIGWRRRVQA